MFVVRMANASSGCRQYPLQETEAFHRIKVREIERIVYENQQLLLEKFHEYHGG